MIRILYFASLKDRLQRDGEQVDLPPGISDIDGLMQHLRQRSGIWAEVFAEDQPVLYALNQEMARLDTPLRDGDEIGFFPPVTGG
jgi:molybdopterin synthase sulfur carrier subunit